MTGATVEGTWFDRTREYNARLRGKDLAKGESASTEVVRLSPLPCWSHLAPEVYLGRIQEMVREINESAISGVMCCGTWTCCRTWIWVIKRSVRYR